MNSLDIARINWYAPYEVKQVGNTLVFATDAHVLLTVSFEAYDEVSGSTAYWLNLTNSSQRPSPRDPKVRDTVISIIEEFFRENPDILLYMCDNANEQQAMRNRLFLHWFDTYELKQRYCVLNAMLLDEGEENYISLIVQRDNPRLKEITAYFNQTVDLFRANKP